MTPDFNWNDLRAFLAVARMQKLILAARRLDIDHSTLSRRISALETQLKVQLFERDTRGHSLTTAGLRLLELAESVEGLAMEIGTSVPAMDSGLAGTLRLATPEGFGTVFLAPRLPQFNRDYPDLSLELIANSAVVSLPKREADLAVMMARPGKGRLQARKLTDDELGLYASSGYLSCSAPLETVADIARHRIIGYIDDLLPTEHHAYLNAVLEAARVGLGISNVMTQLRATLEGAGICIPPCFMAREHPSLVRLVPHGIAIRRAYWGQHIERAQIYVKDRLDLA